MRVLSVIVLSCFLFGVLAHKSPTLKTDGARVKFQSHFHEWLTFKKTHDKTYAYWETEMRRYEVFKSNLLYIEQHNQLYNQGSKSFFLGINAFTDLSHEEFVKYMHLNVLMRHRTVGASQYLPPSFVQLPDSVDWRTKGYVTGVKNQGQCGSCWSFSTTGSLEGRHFNKSGQLISLSEQQLVDCSETFGDHGCNGGLMDYAFDYVQQYGIEAEATYPYRAKQYECKYNSSLVVAKCKGHTDVQRKESALKSAVATVGPVSVAIDANHKSFQHYQGGVYDEPACSSTRLDHGVLAVGYGTDESGNDYWLVKNSWGEEWGENGYIKMSRNKNNQCGIATSASYPLV